MERRDDPFFPLSAASAVFFHLSKTGWILHPTGSVSTRDGSASFLCSVVDIGGIHSRMENAGITFRMIGPLGGCEFLRDNMAGYEPGDGWREFISSIPFSGRLSGGALFDG